MKWLLMIFGFLTLLVIGFAGLMMTQTIDQETQQADVEPDAGQEREAMMTALEARCEKNVADRMGGKIEDEQLQDACKCAAETIYEEFEDELPAMMTSGSPDQKAEKRANDIVEQCVHLAGLHLP